MKVLSFLFLDVTRLTKLSEIRASTSECGTKTLKMFRFVCLKMLITLATGIAQVARSLPICGVPRNRIPRVDQNISWNLGSSVDLALFSA